MFLDTLPLLPPRLWAPARPPPQVLRVGQLITQASAHSSAFLKTPAPFPASTAPAADWNHLYLPASRCWELALSNSSSPSHTAPPGPPTRHHQEAGGGTCVGEGEKSAGRRGEGRWGTGVEPTATVHQVLTGGLLLGEEGAQQLVSTALGDTPSRTQALAARTGAGGALRSSHDSKQGTTTAGTGARPRPTPPTVHCSTEAPNHPVSGPLYR